MFFVTEWANDDVGRKALSERVLAQEVRLVVVEASGGYEAAIVSELVERGQAVALVNPTRVRAFARWDFINKATVGCDEISFSGEMFDPLITVKINIIVFHKL